MDWCSGSTAVLGVAHRREILAVLGLGSSAHEEREKHEREREFGEREKERAGERTCANEGGDTRLGWL